jgi:ribonuclease P protein component
VYRQGRSKSNRFLVLYGFARAPEQNDATTGPRLGLSVSRRVGGAVDRTHVKRVLREAFWAEAERLPAGSDYVVVARPDARELAEREGTAGVRSALRELVDAFGGVSTAARTRAGEPVPGEGGEDGTSAPDEHGAPLVPDAEAGGRPAREGNDRAPLRPDGHDPPPGVQPGDEANP